MAKTNIYYVCGFYGSGICTGHRWGWNCPCFLISRNSARKFGSSRLELSRGSFISYPVVDSGCWSVCELRLSAWAPTHQASPFGRRAASQGCVSREKERFVLPMTQLWKSLSVFFATLYLKGSCYKDQAIFKGKEIRCHPFTEIVSRSNCGPPTIAVAIFEK